MKVKVNSDDNEESSNPSSPENGVYAVYYYYWLNHNSQHVSGGKPSSIPDYSVGWGSVRGKKCILPPKIKGRVLEICVIYDSFFSLLSAIRVQGILYRLMCWLSGSLTCRLRNVLRSPPARSSQWIQSLLIDFWLFIDEVSTLSLNLLTTQTMVTTGILSPHKENSHGRAGNRTRDLVISGQKLWPLDHEAGD